MSSRSGPVAVEEATRPDPVVTGFVGAGEGTPRRPLLLIAAVVGAVAVLGAGMMIIGLGDGDGEGDGQVRTAREVVQAPVSGGRLVYGLAGDPESLDPGRTRWDASGLQVASALYDPIAALDAEGRPQPYLVESFTPASDLTSWILRLRTGVVLSNGDPLDAAELVDVLQAMRRSPVGGSIGKLITDVRAVDDLSVRLTTARPWATLPVHLAGQSGYVVSPKQIAIAGGVSIGAGTGPFLLRRWDRGKHLDLVRNPRYWRAGLPRLDAVELTVVPDGAARVEGVRQGDFDAVPLTTPEEQGSFDEANGRLPPDERLPVERDTSGSSASAIALNTKRPPFDDVRVRRALARATDLPAIARVNGWSPDRLASGPLAPDSPFFTSAPYPAPDVAAAKALVTDYLSSASPGGSAEVTFTLEVANVDTTLTNRLVNQWARAGIRAKLSVLDAGELWRRAATGESEAVVLDAFASLDPDQLWPHLAPAPGPPGETLNVARTNDPVVADAMEDGQSTTDPGTRRSAYERVQRALADQVPYLWLVRTEMRLATSRRVRDARNATLPDGRPAMPFTAGTHRLTETWLAS